MLESPIELSAFSSGASLRRSVRANTLTLAPGAPVADALPLLEMAHVDAVAVVDAERGVPLGILTLRDVLRRVVSAGAPLDTPVAAVMTGGLVTLSADATIHAAGVQMVRRRLRHVVLVEPDGRFAGIVSQSDLFSRSRGRGGELMDAIAGAADIEALAHAAALIRRHAAELLAEGMATETLCQQVSALNDLVSLQAIDLVAANHELPYVPWCWLAFGSEGRLEQTLSTDQDNGLLFLAELPEETERLRQQFLPFAQAVNKALDACGFPLCKGNVMAGNAELSLSLDEWRSRFDGWLQLPEPQAVLNATIFFDFRPLAGDEGLASALRQHLFARVPMYDNFLRAMVQASLEWSSPLGWFSTFRYDNNPDFPHTLDIKKHGVRPWVDAARVWALANGVAATNTAERLRSVAPRIGMPHEELTAYLAALDHAQRLRLRRQVSASVPAEANLIDPDDLNELDRLIMKEVFKQVKLVQQRLERSFGLGG